MRFCALVFVVSFFGLCVASCGVAQGYVSIVQFVGKTVSPHECEIVVF